MSNTEFVPRNGLVVPAGTRFVAPVGNTAQRPASPRDGDFRYNSQLAYFEAYANGAYYQVQFVNNSPNVVIAGSLQVGNSTVNVYTNSSSMAIRDSSGNTHTANSSALTFANATVTVVANVAGLYVGANVVVNTTSVAVGNSTVSLAMNSTSLIVGAVTVNTSQVRVGNSTVFAFLAATGFSGTSNNAAYLGGFPAADYAFANAVSPGQNAAGSNTWVQYNNSGSFGAGGGLKFNYQSNTLTIGTATVNSTTFSGTANNASFLGGTAAASFLTAITSGMITTALGFTPFSASGGTIAGDITVVSGGSNAGTVFLGNLGTRYLGYNGSAYVMPSAPLVVNGSAVWTAQTLTNLNQLTNGPAYLTTITSGQVTTALGFTPYNSSNPSGYLTGINSGQVTTALGYTPYNSTNPSGYITGISSGMVTSALGYTPYNSSNPSGYLTSASLASNVATMTANNSTYLNSQLASYYLNRANHTGTEAVGALSSSVNYVCNQMTAATYLYSSGHIYAVGDVYSAYSDARLKFDIKPILSPLDIVCSLSGYEYYQNELGDELTGLKRPKKQYGLLVQDVERVIPEIVSLASFDMDEDGGSKSGENYKTYSESKIIPFLVESIKALRAEIEELKRTR